MVGARRGVEAWSQVVHQLTKLQTSEQNGGCAGEMTMPALAGERRSERAKCGVAAPLAKWWLLSYARLAVLSGAAKIPQNTRSLFSVWDSEGVVHEPSVRKAVAGDRSGRTQILSRVRLFR